MLRRRLLDAAPPSVAARAGWADGGVNSGALYHSPARAMPICSLSPEPYTPITLTPHPALTLLRPTRCLHTRQGMKRKGGTSNLGHRKPNKTPEQERHSARNRDRYHMKKAAKAAHPQ